MKNNASLSILVLLITGLLPLLLSSCVATNTESRSANIAPASDLIRVGVSSNAPPLVYSKDGEILGLEADFARKLGEFTGKQIKFVELKWDKQIEALEKDRKSDV